MKRNNKNKRKGLVLIIGPLLTLVSFIVTYYIDPLKYTTQSPLAAIPAFLLSIVILIISQTISVQNEVDQVSVDSERIYQTLKNYLSVTKMGTPKSAWEYIVNNLSTLEYVQNTSFNFHDENDQTQERLYEDEHYIKSLKMISKYIDSGLIWKDIGDEFAVKRFNKIQLNISKKCKGHYSYKLIEHKEPQISFILLTYKDGTTEVLFNWDFRDIPQDPVVLLSRDQEIINMFAAQYKGLWRVAVDNYDKIATKSTS